MSKKRELTTLITVAVMILIYTSFSEGQGVPPHAVQGSVLDGIGLAGQMWVANGTYSPVEKNNVLSQWDFKQSASIFSAWHNSVVVAPYAELGVVFDTAGHNWNRKIVPSAGIKVDKLFRNGVISVGTAYSYESRFGGQSASGRTDYVSGWFGWQAAAEQKNRFPGSAWAVAGHISPVERGDLIAQASVTQGFVLRRFDRAALVPYAEATVGHDSQGLDWENKLVSGGGIKCVIPARKVYLEFGTGIMHENRFNSALSATGFKVFMNASYAWHLFGRGE